MREEAAEHSQDKDLYWRPSNREPSESRVLFAAGQREDFVRKRTKLNDFFKRNDGDVRSSDLEMSASAAKESVVSVEAR